jgi:hypothetical protein
MKLMSNNMIPKLLQYWDQPKGLYHFGVIVEVGALLVYATQEEIL